MTRDQLVGRVRQNLEDTTGIFFDPTFVAKAIQDAYDEVAVATCCIVKTTRNLKFLGGVVHYDFLGSDPNEIQYQRLVNGGHFNNYQIIPDYFKGQAIFNQQTNRWMECKDKLVLNRFRFDWELSGGTPWFWTLFGNNLISFFPHYSGTGWPYTIIMGYFDLIYSAQAPTLVNGTDSPLIPGQHQQILEFYATADLLESIKEFTKAAGFWKKYYKQSQALKLDVSTQMLPDQMFYYENTDAPLVAGG